MGDKTSYMLSREYAGTAVASEETEIKRPKKDPGGFRLSAVSLGVLNEYFVNVRQKPDATASTVLSDVLGLSEKTISAWFERERETEKKI